MKKETYFHYYVVISHKEHNNCRRYRFANYRIARERYRNLKNLSMLKRSTIVSVEFQYVLVYFNNDGLMHRVIGSNKKDAYEKLDYILEYLD